MTLTTITNIVFIVNILLALVVILDGSRSPQSSLSWILVLFFLPGIGFILYLLFGTNTRKSKLFSMKELQDRHIKAQIYTQKKQISNNTYPFEDAESVDYRELVQLNLVAEESFYAEDNDVQLYYWGQELFDQMKKDLKEAKHSIDFQTYIFKPDDLGNEILSILTEKAKEGVKVRLLIDSLGGRMIRQRHLTELIEAGGQVAFFFPSFLRIINPRVNYRNHRKIIVLDDEISYIGGFNVGNDYLGQYVKFGPWRDTHCRIHGSTSLALKVRFAKDWCYTTGESPRDLENLGNNKPMKRPGNVACQIITSGPDTEAAYIKNAILKMINMAKKEIYFQTPYFVPDDSILDALKIALASGVKVYIMIPAKKDHPFVFWANLNYVGELLAHGAEIYYYQKGFLHSKVVIVDDFLSTVGSANMDNRSFNLNFEANALFYDYQMNTQLKEAFEKDIEDSLLLTKGAYASRSRIVKLLEGISKLLSPLL